MVFLAHFTAAVVAGELTDITMVVDFASVPPPGEEFVLVEPPIAIFQRVFKRCLTGDVTRQCLLILSVVTSLILTMRLLSALRNSYCDHVVASSELPGCDSPAPGQAVPLS